MPNVTPAAEKRIPVGIWYNGVRHETGPWTVSEQTLQTPPAPPPPAPGEQSVDVQKLKDSNDALATRLTEQTAKVRKFGGFAGRVVAELGLDPKVLEDDSFDIGKTLSDLKAAKANADAKKVKAAAAKANGKTSDDDEPNAQFTEEDLNRARIEARDAERRVRTAETDAERTARIEAERRWKRDRVRSWLTEVSTDPNSTLRIATKTAFSVLQSPSNDLPWEIVADEDGEGVKVVTKPGPDGNGGGSEVYSKRLNKILEPLDALAELAAVHPGILMTQPHPSVGARRGVVSTAQQTGNGKRSVADMKPNEKLRGAFTQDK